MLFSFLTRSMKSKKCNLVRKIKYLKFSNIVNNITIWQIF